MENREILAVRPPETPTPDRLGAALDNSSVRASLPFRVFLYYCDQDFASFGFLQSSFCFCCTSIDGRDRVPNTTTSFPLVACRRETRYSIKKQQQQQQQKGGPRMTKLACSSGLGARREKKNEKNKKRRQRRNGYRRGRGGRRWRRPCWTVDTRSGRRRRPTPTRWSAATSASRCPAARSTST